MKNATKNKVDFKASIVNNLLTVLVSLFSNNWERFPKIFALSTYFMCEDSFCN